MALTAPDWVSTATQRPLGSIRPVIAGPIVLCEAHHFIEGTESVLHGRHGP